MSLPSSSMSTPRGVGHQPNPSVHRLDRPASRATAPRPSASPAHGPLAASGGPRQAAAPAASSSSSQASPLILPPHAAPKWSRRQLISTTMATVFAAGCPCCAGVGAARADGGSAPWGYSTTDGTSGASFQNLAAPQQWPGVCQSGRTQSPVNVLLTDKVHPNSPCFTDLIFKYAPADRTLVTNPGHGSMQVNFAPGNTCEIGTKTYELLQFHFHTPSEHALDGSRYAMEAHLVHKNKDTGNLAVVGVMLQPDGPDNAALEIALDAGPPAGAELEFRGYLDPMLLLPKPSGGKGDHRPFVHYEGSLTTPPCSEVVDWFVMTKPLRVGSGQILRFMKFVGGNKTYAFNARPVQPSNLRAFDYEL